MRIPTLILAFASAALAQAPSARLEGIVRSASGDAIPRATVTLEGPEDDDRPVLIATSDDSGKFRFDAPPGRDYFLSAKRQGFVETRRPRAPLTLDRGAVINNIVIAMEPQGIVTGRVSDSSGDPVVSAPVIALQPTYERGERRIAMAARALTNDQGEYRIANLAPGDYYIGVADKRIVSTAPDRPKEAHAMTYFPNGADIRDASSLRVIGGAELRGIDVNLRRERVYSIRGKVVDEAGRPAHGALLAALAADETIIDAALDGPSGGGLQLASQSDASFEFRGLKSGAYIIQTLPSAMMKKPANSAFIGRLRVTVSDRDVNGAVLVAGAGATVSGSVEIEGADVRAMSMTPEVGLEEVSVLALNTPAAQPIAADGTFRIEGLASAQHYIAVTELPDNVYMKSARFNGEDATHRAIDLSSGGNLEIVLSPKAAGITGIVRDALGQSLGAVPVTLWPAAPDEGSATRGIRTSASDQNGAFEFHSLPPGEYFLAAWEEAEPGLLEYYPFLTLFNSAAAPLKLAENAHGAVEAPLIPAGKFKVAESQLR